MPWHVRITRKANKELAGMPQPDREAMLRALLRLADNPGSVDMSKLAGTENEWRLRVGRWRVRLQLDNSIGVIQILRVQPRKDAYRD